MVDRRSFFKLMAGVAPALFLPKLIVPTFKQTLKYGWIVGPLNPEMPFLARRFGGKWHFVLDSAWGSIPGEVEVSPMVTPKQWDVWQQWDVWRNDMLD